MSGKRMHNWNETARVHDEYDRAQKNVALIPSNKLWNRTISLITYWVQLKSTHTHESNH